MRRKRLILALGALALAAVAGVAYELWDRHRPGVTQANYEKIADGMSLEEARAVIGVAPFVAYFNFYGIGLSLESGIVRFSVGEAFPSGENKGTVYWWAEDQAGGTAVYFEDGKVVAKRWQESRTDFFSCLRTWLGL